MSEPGRRIGVFGGTFDPIHVGHLILAEQAREQGRLDQVRFVLSARPPHKLTHPLTPFHKRAEMLALALAGQPVFRVDEREKERAGPSYTADTLADLRAETKDAKLLLIVGSDCLPDLPGWHDPERVVAQASLLVMARAGWPVMPIEQLREQLRLPSETALELIRIEAPAIEIASRDLRARVAAGRTIRYLVPRAVECYIETHRLYLPGDPEKRDS